MVFELVLHETTGGVPCNVDHWIGKNRWSTMSSGYCKSALYLSMVHQHYFDSVYPFTINQFSTLSTGYQY
jgi:hypothetical protein